MVKECGCRCQVPTPSGILVFGAEKCAKCGLLIEAIGQKGCGE